MKTRLMLSEIRGGEELSDRVSQKIGLERVVRYGSTHREGRGELVVGHFAVQCAARGKAGGWEGARTPKKAVGLARVSESTCSGG